jgi:hypothetical protein
MYSARSVPMFREYPAASIVVLSWCTRDRIVLVYWRSYYLGILEIILSWCTGDHIVLVYWRSYCLGLLEIVLSWCTGDYGAQRRRRCCSVRLHDVTCHKTAIFKSVQYSDLIFINLRGLQFTCKGKLSRGVCSSLSIDSSCLTAVLQNIIQLADKQRPKAYVNWAVKLCDTNQNPLLTHSMEQNPSWKATRFSASQIPRILWIP